MSVFRRRSVKVLVTILTALSIYSVALASFRNNPPPLAGFTHSPFSPDDSTLHIGKLLAGGAVVRSSPVIAKISTQSTGNQVAVGGADGIVHVYRRDGT